MTSSRNERDVTVAMLCARFPKAFFLYERRRVPLKIGIRNDVIAVLGDAIDRKLLVRALKHYFVNLGYQLAVRAGRPRYDLDGNIAGEVTELEAESARRSAAGIRALRAPRKRPRPQAIAPETPAPPPPPSSPPEPPRRLGLADLRAAALARKASAACDQTRADADGSSAQSARQIQQPQSSSAGHSS
jgi:sRNA-binding protein